MDRRDFLFVQSTTEQGGAETVLLNAFSASPELRARSVVATLGFGTGDLPARLRAEGVPVIELEPVRLRRPPQALGVAWRLAAESRMRHVRVLVGNGAHPQVFAGAASRLAGARSAYFVHMIHRERLFANHPIDVLAIRGPCDLVMANSQTSLAAMRKLRPRLRSELVYPGTSTGSPAAEGGRAARDEFGIGPDELVFGVFGRLHPGKGQDVFLEAACDVARRCPSARFVVVGGTVFGLEPEFEVMLRQRCGDLGIASRVTFTGQRPDVKGLMAACDVVCHTSRAFESFGMVIVEAMAQARAVIATRTGGPGEIVVDGETGILVPPGDRSALAGAMLRLADDQALRNDLAVRGRRRAEEHFSSERFASRLLEVLTRVA